MDTKRQRLLTVATSLFAKKGYAEVSTREICEKAKINLGGISYHFGGKEGLCIAVMDEFMKKLSERLDRIQSPDLNQALSFTILKDFFKDIIHVLIEVRFSLPETEILSHRNLFEEIPKIRTSVDNALGPILDKFVLTLDTAKSQGLIDQNFNSRAFFVILFKSVWGYISSQYPASTIWKEAYQLPKDKEVFTEFMLNLLTPGVFTSVNLKQSS